MRVSEGSYYKIEDQLLPAQPYNMFTLAASADVTRLRCPILSVYFLFRASSVVIYPVSSSVNFEK